MKPRILLLFLFLLLGCALNASSVSDEVIVEEKDAGKTVQLVMGQILSLGLVYNSDDTPAPIWWVDEYQPSLLEQIGNTSKSSGRRDGKVNQIFGFRAKKAGECDLKLSLQDYCSAFNEKPAKKVFKVHVVVVSPDAVIPSARR